MSYLIDILILLLLGGTLGYAFLVDRRVRMLMAVLREMEPMVGQFSDAVDKSESTVSMLKSMSDKVRAPIMTRPAEKREEVVSFRSTRHDKPAERPAGVTRVSGKSDLVRGFFETAKTRGA
ncbi:flagellar motor switch protein [Pseudooceanicola sp. C21-150M6]|uniref:flagellar motor switch protein n=1 Tax=Pseudooceanicola sp. C21-150M6 TaxID=3434355 RepID=UPI003D7F6825